MYQHISSSSKQLFQKMLDEYHRTGHSAFGPDFYGHVSERTLVELEALGRIMLLDDASHTIQLIDLTPIPNS